MVVAAASFFTLLPVWSTWWGGCATPPVFNSITEIVVQTQTPGGISRKPLEGEQLQRASNCLYSTEEIKKDQGKAELIQEIVLLQVKDRYADRIFEMVTDENMTGNKGKYYRNPCIYKIIKGM